MFEFALVFGFVFDLFRLKLAIWLVLMICDLYSLDLPWCSWVCIRQNFV